MELKHYKQLNKIEKELHNAVYGSYVNYMTEKNVDIVENVYRELANDPYYTIKRSCGACLIKTMQRIGMIYFNQKAKMLLFIEEEKNYIQNTKNSLRKLNEELSEKYDELEEQEAIENDYREKIKNSEDNDEIGKLTLELSVHMRTKVNNLKKKIQKDESRKQKYENTIETYSK